ncbi:hypothetical protein SteCoe_23593 [Stentor coeruleus]|uniref:C2 domain-containing protein n=1 Tax=Stentor coeruleus TaxID=5963 RepID=A0A1R2BJY7_9CILI|nr:hypothetical protein SteCoe_23593 [Stentor coeruleus]
MKASSGIILNIFETQIDSNACDLSKMNLYILVTHGSIELSTKSISVGDFHPKWNQVFYIERQCDKIEFTLYHKPLLLKEIPLGSCVLLLQNQNGWVHLLKDKQKIGSLKLSISNEILPLDTANIQDLYHKKLSEVQSLKNKVLKYRLKYKQTKAELNKKAPNKLNEIINILKTEQEKYLKTLEEVNEKKNKLKEKEEFILKEKDKLIQERERLRIDELEIRKNTCGLQNDFAELQRAGNKLSLQEKIFKASHRNSKSEGRNSGLPTSPYSRAKTNAGIPNSVSSFIL